MKCKVFISHRHADKEIADKVNVNLRMWGVESIYQSSDPRFGPRVGRKLTDELRTELYESNLLILIYTFEDEGWAYCTWECGLATDASKEESTRIVVLQCTDDVPIIYEDAVRVTISKTDIERFTRNFHCEQKFLPGTNQAFQPSIDEEILQRRSGDLFKDLQKVIPSGKMEPRYRWDFFTLSLEPADVRRIKEESERNLPDVITLISEKAIVKSAFGDASRHFGYQSFPQGTTLQDVIERWKNETEGKYDSEWTKDLKNEIMRAINDYAAKPSSNSFHTAREGAKWLFLPIVNQARIFPDESMEFDVYLYEMQPQLSAST